VNLLLLSPRSLEPRVSRFCFPLFRLGLTILFFSSRLLSSDRINPSEKQSPFYGERPVWCLFFWRFSSAASFSDFASSKLIRVSGPSARVLFSIVVPLP